jgi:hypothetical protein
MHDNNISNISALSNLTNLRTLILYENSINSVNPLKNLTNLTKIELYDNFITNISPLVGVFPARCQLDLKSNPLNSEAYCTYLNTLHEEGLYVDYDEKDTPPTDVMASDSTYPDKVVIIWNEVCNGYRASLYRVLRANSPQGAKTDISGWQRDLSYTDTTVQLSIEYTYWVQTTTSNLGYNPGDYSIPDNGMAGPIPIITVDDDAIGDPGMGDVNVSDPLEDGTPEHPFDAIQEAIDAAPDSASIMISPGTYFENITLSNKTIQLMGYDPNSHTFPLIKGDHISPVISITGNQDVNCVLDGLFISDGAIGIMCINTSPKIMHCVIEGTNDEGPGILCQDSNAVIINCTITGNTGALISENGQVVLDNCILWDNGPQSIMVVAGANPLITYSNIQGLDPSYVGNGNIDTDPLFADPGYWDNNNTPEDPNDDVWITGDYHLQSQAGRWDPITQVWVEDEQTSPCIDAGDPNTDISMEPEPNGNLINLGAYGSTNKASKSLE